MDLLVPAISSQICSASSQVYVVGRPPGWEGSAGNRRDVRGRFRPGCLLYFPSQRFRLSILLDREFIALACERAVTDPFSAPEEILKAYGGAPADANGGPPVC